jgi:hypothetical protein
VRERAAEEPTACLALFKELVELWIVHPPEAVLQRVVAWCYSFRASPLMPLIEELGRNVIHCSDDGSFVTSFVVERVTKLMSFFAMKSVNTPKR